MTHTPPSSLCLPSAVNPPDETQWGDVAHFSSFSKSKIMAERAAWDFIRWAYEDRVYV